MARNKSLHRIEMLGGKWQPSIASKYGVPESERTAIGAVEAILQEVLGKGFPLSIAVEKTLNLFAELSDDMDKRISAIEDAKSKNRL